jgi:hypothetical protein
MKAKLKKIVDKKTERVFKESDVLVVLEKMENNIEIIAEGQIDLKNDVSVLKQDVSVLKQDVSVLKQDVSVLKQDVSVLKQGVSVLKEKVTGIEANMKITLEYLFRIDNEIQDIKKELMERKKQDTFNKEWMASMEKRIKIIEKQLKIQENAA